MSHPLALHTETQPWYRNGLPFECTGCGQCCTGSPGYVWVTVDEILQMAQHLDLSVEKFCQTFVRQVGDRYSLKEDPRSFDCVFLKEKRCAIYPVRPSQCKTFPWWPQNLESPESWKSAASYCEGIRPDASIVSKDEIEQNLSQEQKRWESTS